MGQLHRKTFLAAVTLALSLAVVSAANAAVIGSWETGAPEGWINWSGGQAPIGAPAFAFNSIGATNGTGAVQFNLPNGGFTQWAAKKLQDSAEIPAFLASSKLKVDITLVASEQVVAAGNNFVNIGLVVNAAGYGFTSEGNPESVTPFTGFGGVNSFNPQQLVGTQTSTWTWDIADTHDGIGTDIAASPGYVEVVFETFSNGGVVYHIDNVRLVPEPTSLGLLGLTAPALLLAIRRRRNA